MPVHVLEEGSYETESLSHEEGSIYLWDVSRMVGQHSNLTSEPIKELPQMGIGAEVNLAYTRSNTTAMTQR